jgi:hypothetical protein
MTIWNQKELYDLVKQKYGQTHAIPLKSALISIEFKLYIAKYHADESNKIIHQVISSLPKENHISIVKLIFDQATHTKIGKNFSSALFKAEANIIAHAQALHSLADIFSQVIYVSLNLDKNINKQIPESSRSLYNVNKALKKLPQFFELNDNLEIYLNSAQFKYLNAYVNTTKHRSLIPVAYSISFNQNDIEPMHGLRISGFEYNDEIFPSKWTIELLGDDYAFIENSLLKIGHIINSEANKISN